MGKALHTIPRTPSFPLYMIMILLFYSISPLCIIESLGNELNDIYSIETDPSKVYVIITTENIGSQLDQFLQWKQDHGYTVHLITITWIENQYNGEDLEESIRLFLIDNYQSWDIHYVLLIGSHDTIPMRYCYPFNYYNGSDHVPTDLYYADLTGDWDSDHDGYYGEKQDAVDFSAEVSVGRISFDDPSQVTSFLNKTMMFQNDSRDWKKNALLMGSFLWLNNYKGHNDTETDGAVCNELIWDDILSKKDIIRTTLYEKNGYAPSSFPCDLPLNNTNICHSWVSGYGLVNWVGHGSTNSLKRLIWTYDNGDNVPYTGNDIIETVSFFSNEDDDNGNDVGVLNDSTPSIMFSTGCDNANIDDSYRLSLAESLLLNGVVLFIGPTDDVFGPLNWTTVDDGGVETIDYLFFKHFIINNQSCAKSLNEAKTEYKNNYMMIGDESWNIQNLYCMNVFGDPSLYLQEEPDKPVISAPSSVQKGKAVEIHFTLKDTQKDTLYLQIDWGDGTMTDWLGPFASEDEIKMSHIWSNTGSCTIEAQAKDAYNWTSNVAIYDVHVEKSKSLTNLLNLFNQYIQYVLDFFC